MEALDPAVIALIGTIFGGVGIKFAEHWLGRGKIKIDDATQIRNELRLEITVQREEIKQLEKDVDRWREEYYTLRDKYVALNTELTLALQSIKTEATEAQLKVEEVERLPPDTSLTEGDK